MNDLHKAFKSRDKVPYLPTPSFHLSLWPCTKLSLPPPPPPPPPPPLSLSCKIYFFSLSLFFPPNKAFSLVFSLCFFLIIPHAIFPYLFPNPNPLSTRCLAECQLLPDMAPGRSPVCGPGLQSDPWRHHCRLGGCTVSG